MLKKGLPALLIILLLLFVAVLLFRNTALHMVFAKAQKKLQEEYNLQLSASSVYFSGLDNIYIENLSIKPDSADTLASIKLIELNLSLTDLLTGKVGFDEIGISHALITAYNLPYRNNINVHSKASTTPYSKPARGYRNMANGLKAKLVRAFNTAFTMQQVRVLYADSTGVKNIVIPHMQYNRQQLSGLLINQNTNDTLSLEGTVLERNKSYQFSMARSDTSATYLPLLNRGGKIKCSFKSINAWFGFNNQADELLVSAKVQVQNFHINHWRLANDDVIFENAGFNGTLKIGDHSIELDSASEIKMGHTAAHVFARYQQQPDSVFTLQVHMPETVSDTFFHSLPQGMFNTLKGISCTGSLAYNLYFQLNTAQPDSLIFSSALSKKDFGIRHYGVENYSRMQNPFTYQAYDKDKFVRAIEVGPANPMFTPLNHISDYLIKSVLQSEDPSFMLHRGFLPEAFRESIAKNYKERRFARGGSTISMQLVKNVFLSRDKTVSRKAEEALIVYLIENLRLASKERMLEVYLNVIEWGPNVYGIGEAARFYFNKTPAELSLQESIFLAGIIPRPKYFKYQFDKEGRLKNYLDDYFRILTGRMASKGWITSADTSGLLPDVKLKGPALRMIVPVDTLFTEPEDDL